MSCFHERNSIPKFSRYKCKSISTLLREREFGNSSCVFRKRLVRNTNNSHSDLQLLRCLWCDSEAYLETIACRKIARPKAPAFCHGRFFTENYQTWFNTFTGPTSGPLLMTSNLFKNEALSQSTAVIKVIDIASITPPNNCRVPHGRTSIASHIVLLTKSGWLYEADLETCDILSKTYIPTKEFANSVFQLAAMESEEENQSTDDPMFERAQFNYHYLSVNKDSESIVVKSSRFVASGTTFESFCVFLIYPLRLCCHFIVKVSSHSNISSVTPDISDDMFILNAAKASNVYIYSLQEVIQNNSFGKNFSLDEEVDVLTPCGISERRRARIGDKSLGIPYTMRNILLSSNKFQVNAPCLFNVASMKHFLQIGGPPFHYLACTSKNGTSWVLKHVNNMTEVQSGKLQVESKWDSTHWDSIRFLPDDTGRFIHQGLSSMEMLSFEHSHLENSVDFDDSETATTSQTSLLHCQVVSNFRINLEPIFDYSRELKWHFPGEVPPLPSHTVTAHGRAIRKPRRWWSNIGYQNRPPEPQGHLLLCTEYDQELNLLVIVHYRPSDDLYAHEGWENEEERSELVVSLFDSFYGNHLSSFVLETETSPSDRDVVSLTLDQDTIVYNRSRANDNRIQYKILRLNRKYGTMTENI